MPEQRILLDVGELPLSTSFRIFKRGENTTRKGTFLFDERSAKAVMADAADFANEYPLDYGHSMFSDVHVDPAESHKAAGWFKLTLRDGELWATNVTWTKAAQAKLRDREFRYVSPAFQHDADRRIVRLLNVALTNVPATHGLTPLMAAIDFNLEGGGTYAALLSAFNEGANQMTHARLTSDGIEIPNDEALASVGLSSEEFLAGARKLAKGSPSGRAFLSGASRSFPASNALKPRYRGFPLEVPSDADLELVGLSREQFLSSERKMIDERLDGASQSKKGAR